MMKSLILAILVSVASSAAIEPTKPGDCNVKTADIAFIVDASGSVSDIDWTKSLAFIAKLVEGFDIGTNAVRVAAMQFSGFPKIMFDFNAHSDVTKLKTAILGMGKISGGTQTDAALDLARMHLFTTGRGMRNGVPHLLFVITDGVSNSRPLTVASAQKLHQLGLTVFAMGVGGAQQDELKAIASSPTYVYTISDYSKLAQIQQKFQKETCEVANSLIETTTQIQITSTPPTTTLELTTTAPSQTTTTMSSETTTELHTTQSSTNAACYNDPGWAKVNCPIRCGLCSGQIPVTKPSKKICEDKVNCSMYGSSMCIDYAEYASVNCPLYCGFCVKVEPIAKCVDTTDCAKYGDLLCTDFLEFASLECPHFCGLCS